MTRIDDDVKFEWLKEGNIMNDFVNDVRKKAKKEVFYDLDGHKEGYDFLNSNYYKNIKKKHLGD